MELCRSAVMPFLVAALVAGCAGMPGTAPDYAAIVAAPDRNEADRTNDARRKPAQMLAFAGVHSGMKVLDLGAGRCSGA